jgi:hypothetical protein
VVARRVLAVLVLGLVAVVAIRLVLGLVVGLVSGVLWIVVVAALVAAGLWARSTLKSARRRRGVKQPSSSAAELAAAPGEDPVVVEMRRITEQLREQGRRLTARELSQTSTRPGSVACVQLLVRCDAQRRQAARPAPRFAPSMAPGAGRPAQRKQCERVRSRCPASSASRSTHQPEVHRWPREP